MDVQSLASDADVERLLFAVGAVVAALLTVLVFRNGDDLVQGLLFLSFTAYMAGAAIPAVRDEVSDYRRTGAIALGAVGGIAFLLGTSSALPLLFVVGGAAALLGLF